VVGKLVGFGLTLIGHVTKLLGDIWLAAGRHLPHLGYRHPQENDRLADRIEQVLSHARPSINSAVFSTFLPYARVYLISLDKSEVIQSIVVLDYLELLKLLSVES
jgi:hypothetical protein